MKEEVKIPETSMEYTIKIWLIQAGKRMKEVA